MSGEKKNVIDVEEKFKESYSLDEIDFDELQNMGRGQTPEGMRLKCLDLCKDYLGGNWSQQTVDSIQVKRITGGIVNQIYHCSIREPNEREGIPQEVCLKLFDHNIFDLDKSRTKEYVISLMFSELDLGSKIYGIFEGGLIQKYYKHRSFLGEDNENPMILRKVCQSLAKIHSLELPLKKDQGLFTLAENILKEGYEKGSLNKHFEEYNCETFKKYDLRTEFYWIKGLIERVKSPILFTHNDYRSSNLMITEPNDELIVCDFDLSGYGYRGNDFASLMKEWGNRKPLDFKTIEGLPLNNEFKPFIEIYVEESIRIHGKNYTANPINSVDHILKEAKVFLMSSYVYMFIILMKCIWDVNFKSPFPGNPKLIMELMELQYKQYFIIKEIFKQQKVFE